MMRKVDLQYFFMSEISAKLFSLIFLHYVENLMISTQKVAISKITPWHYEPDLLNLRTGSDTAQKVIRIFIIRF